MSVISIPLPGHIYPLPDKEKFMKGEIVLTKEEVPSSTTITGMWPKGEGFERWIASQGSYENAMKARDEGGVRGTRVHDLTAHLLSKQSLSFDQFVDEFFHGNKLDAVKQWKMLEAFVRWHVDFEKPELLAMEKTVYSWEHKYAGTLDRVFTGGSYGEKKVLLDIKTSSEIYESHWAQVASYAKAWEEMGEEPITHVAILRLGSKHKCGYEYIEKEIDEEWFLDFLACYRLWKRENPKFDGRKYYNVESILSL